MKRAILILLSTSVAAMAGDAAGVWNLSYTTANGMKRESKLELKEEGNSLVGTLSSDRGTARLENGKLSDGEIVFDLIRNSNYDQITIHFKGRIEGDTMKLTMQYGQREPIVVIGKKGI